MVMRFVRLSRLSLLLVLLPMIVWGQGAAESIPQGKRPISTAQNQKSYGRHSDFVAAVAISPDGKRVASAGDNRLKVTDLETGKELWELKPTKGMSIFSLAFSPDGKSLVAGQSMLYERQKVRKGDTIITTIKYQGEVLVWDAQTGALKGALYKSAEPAWAVAFSPDGKLLAMGAGPAAGGEDESCKGECVGVGEVLIWNTSDWTLVRPLRGSHQPIRTVAFSPDGRRLAGGAGWLEDWQLERMKEGDHSPLLIWELATGELKHSLPGHRRPITSIAFSPDGRLLASASKDRGLKIWDTQTYELKNSASEYMLSVDEIQTILDDVDEKHRKNALPTSSWLTVILFSPDSKYVLGGGGDGIIRFYNANTGKIVQILKPNDWPILGWRTPSPANRAPILSTTSRTRSAEFGGLTDPLTDRRLQMQMMAQRWPQAEGSLNAMAQTLDGRLLVTGNADGKIRVLVLE